LEHSAIGAPGDMERRLRDHASDGALQDQLLSLPCSWSEYLRYATASFHANRRDILSAIGSAYAPGGWGQVFPAGSQRAARQNRVVPLGRWYPAGSDLEWMVGC